MMRADRVGREQCRWTSRVRAAEEVRRDGM